MCRTAVLFISLLSIISPIFAQNIHGNRNHYAEYGPNGDFIAIGGEDIILLNSENQEIRVVNVDSPEGYTLAFSPDGSLLAAETLSNQIYVYNVKAPATPIFFKGLNRNTGEQPRIKISPDNTMLATSNSEKLVIYDLTKGNEGNVLLSVGIDPKNSQRSRAAFDVSADWKTFFHNMQLISVSKEAGKLSYKYGRIINWDGMVTDLSVMSSDAKQVVLTGKNGTEQRLYNLESGDILLRNLNLKTYGIAANKDFSKIIMNQAIWNLKSQKIQILNQRGIAGKNDKEKITVAPNGDFMIGLFQYSEDGRFKENLQVDLTFFNRVEINGDEVHLIKDNANGSKYDIHVAKINEGLRGRSNRNLTNTKKLSTALATSPDGSYGINQLGRVIRRDSMTVSAPIFPVGRTRGTAADISAGNLVAFADLQRIYLYTFPEGIKQMSKGKPLKSILLSKRIPANAKVDLKAAPDNSHVALAVTEGNSTSISLYAIDGTLLKSVDALDVNDMKFSNNSQRFYYTSGKRLNCLSRELVNGKVNWYADDTFSLYAETGKIISFALSSDDNLLAYTAHNGWNKVVRARYGVSLITCNMQPNDRLNVKKN